jgi:hypothetical protein
VRARKKEIKTTKKKNPFSSYLSLVSKKEAANTINIEKLNFHLKG